MMHGLHLADHLCELPAYDGVIDEFFAESGSFLRVLQGLFDEIPRETVRLHHEPPPLVVKVLHDHLGDRGSDY